MYFLFINSGRVKVVVFVAIFLNGGMKTLMKKKKLLL